VTVAVTSAVASSGPEAVLSTLVAVGRWRLEASDRTGGAPVLIGSEEENVEDDVLGTWSDPDPAVDYRLQITLTDGRGRTLVGNIVGPGSNPSVR
jgi:hypothetical protein